MSWKGALIKAGISSDGEKVDIFRGRLDVRGNPISAGKFTHEDFRSNPLSCASGVGGGVAVGTTGAVNLLLFERNAFECCVLGAGQTKIVPIIAAGGLDVAGDLAADEGFEITQGITSRSRSAFTIGTHAFYGKLKFYITDVSGTDDCAFGFRKAMAYGAAIDDYDDMAVLNVISGAITIETIVGDASTVPTNTTDTWGDNEEHTLEVYVSSGGVVTYKIDGAAPTVVAAYTFTDALVVVPFFYLLHTGDFAEATYLREWEVGLQLPR